MSTECFLNSDLSAGMDSNDLRVVAAQLGAREHYTIPRLCHRHGGLVRLHTDFWKPIPVALQSIAARLPIRSVRRLLGRAVADLPDELVTTHSLPAYYWRLHRELSRSMTSRFEVDCKWGEAFARRIASTLSKEKFSAFFGYSSASLEALEAARRLGALAVLDEIAPTHLEDRIIKEERSRFGWEKNDGGTPKAFLDRIEAEWAAADRIVVNSNWSRSALMSEGVSAGKLHVVPLSYAADPLHVEIKSRKVNEPLRVLWVGTLCLRKGLPYAVQAARLLEGAPVTFTFAGPADVDVSLIDWPKNARYLGQVPRTEIAALWKSHHVYILPTLSDGFAITQIEAAAHGLPLIVTSCCGDVVEDGRSGIIIPPRDARAIADAIIQLLDGELNLEEASCAALDGIRGFSPDVIWPVLRAALTDRPD